MEIQIAILSLKFKKMQIQISILSLKFKKFKSLFLSESLPSSQLHIYELVEYFMIQPTDDQLRTLKCITLCKKSEKKTPDTWTCWNLIVWLKSPSFINNLRVFSKVLSKYQLVVAVNCNLLKSTWLAAAIHRCPPRLPPRVRQHPPTPLSISTPPTRTHPAFSYIHRLVTICLTTK